MALATILDSKLRLSYQISRLITFLVEVFPKNIITFQNWLGMKLAALVIGVVIIAFLVYCSIPSQFLVKKCGGRRYLLRDTPDSDEALALLCRMHARMKTLLDRAPSSTEMNRLRARYARISIGETPITSRAVGYTDDKSNVRLCIRNGDEFADDDAVFFVFLHEMAHVMSTSIGHTPEFHANMESLLHYAHKYGLYRFKSQQTTCDTVVRI